jgi:hypothetical protein
MSAADKKFYFALSAASGAPRALSLLQPWLEGAKGELQTALLDVKGVLTSAMQADQIGGDKFHHVLVVFALSMATRSLTDDGVTVADNDGQPILFDKPDEYRKYLFDAGVVSEERYQEAWDIFVDFGVMTPKLDLDVLMDAPAADDATDFCF